MSFVPTVVFDFDGVIHSYTSGWKGETEIPDPPVPGIREAINSIRDAGYKVVVVSTRCKNVDGEYAIMEYFRKHGIIVDDIQRYKPPAICYIDDRAIPFDGNADRLLKKIQNFKPWYEKECSIEHTASSLRRCRYTDILGRPEGEGWFHGWGSAVYKNQDGPVSYSVAIIEKDDGNVVQALPHNVTFIKGDAK